MARPASNPRRKDCCSWTSCRKCDCRSHNAAFCASTAAGNSARGETLSRPAQPTGSNQARRTPSQLYIGPAGASSPTVLRVESPKATIRAPARCSHRSNTGCYILIRPDSKTVTARIVDEGNCKDARWIDAKVLCSRCARARILPVRPQQQTESRRETACLARQTGHWVLAARRGRCDFDNASGRRQTRPGEHGCRNLSSSSVRYSSALK